MAGSVNGFDAIQFNFSYCLVPYLIYYRYTFAKLLRKCNTSHPVILLQSPISINIKYETTLFQNLP